MKYRSLIFSIFCLTMLTNACAQSEDVFGDIGSNVASPSAMVFDTASNRMYLVNSNSRVLYDWRQGNFQVLDITDPLAPVLIKSVQTEAFSGGIYLDTTNLKAYVPNRFTEDDQDTTDLMYTFSTSEASTADLLSYTTSALAKDSYAIACCYPDRRAWVTTSMDEIQYVDLDGDLTPGSLSLLTTLDNGQAVAEAEVFHIALRDNQAIVTRDGGGVMFMNLDEAGVSGAVPVDYLIGDVGYPVGLAYRDNTIYVVGEGDQNGWKKYLLIMDVTNLTPLTDNTDTQKLDKDDDGLLQALIEVGNSPQEVLLTEEYAFVTNMDDDTVSVIDLAALAVVKTIDVGDEPFSLARYDDADGNEKYVYVGNVESNTISIIDIATLAIVATYP